MKGASAKIAQELGSVDANGVGKDIGGRMGGGLVGSMKSLVGPALAVIGSGMFAGFIKDAAAASDATDKFKATMSFAGPGHQRHHGSQGRREVLRGPDGL